MPHFRHTEHTKTTKATKATKTTKRPRLTPRRASSARRARPRLAPAQDQDTTPWTERLRDGGQCEPAVWRSQCHPGQSDVS